MRFKCRKLALFFALSLASLSAIATNKTECKKARNSFADKNSNFEMCAMQHSVPNIFCTKFVDQYRDNFYRYDDLMKAHDSAANGTHQLCSREFLETDRFNLIESHYKASLNLWNDAHCSSETAFWQE